MAKFAKGKHALAISDRSGLAFPWREMVTEWNGAFVHYSEFERKQPQLEPRPFVADPQGLEKDHKLHLYLLQIYYQKILLLQAMFLLMVIGLLFML